MDRETPLTRLVIKEELVALTGDWRGALVLQQMLYWSERIKIIDGYLEALAKRQHDPAPKQYKPKRWIYKSQKELGEELLGIISAKTIGARLEMLCQRGWLERQSNPSNPRDNTLQYRVLLDTIRADLKKLGYVLEGYGIPATAGVLAHTEDLPAGAEEVPCPSGSSSQTIPETTSENTAKTTTATTTTRADGDSEPSTPQPPAKAKSTTSTKPSKAPTTPCGPPPPPLAALWSWIIAEFDHPGLDYRPKPLPRTYEKLEALAEAVDAIGGTDEAKEYLSFALEKGPEWMANFGWGAPDLYALLCNGAVNAWQFKTGRKQLAASGLPSAKRQRLDADEWSDEDDDYSLEDSDWT